MIAFFLLFLLNIQFCVGENNLFIDPVPINVIKPAFKQFSLINSVDFHPYENLFCVTYTHHQSVVIYKINSDGIDIVQTLTNPQSKLSHPAYAAFCSNGNDIVVANWTNQTFNFHRRESNGMYSHQPVAIIKSPDLLSRHKPHGMSFSPCGNFLAVAYGSTKNHQNAIAIYKIKNRHQMVLHSALFDKDIAGTPKGIAFAPDGNSLLVTFSDTNSISIFALSQEMKIISPMPYQVIQGEDTCIDRPEEIKISKDGTLCVISNSSKNSLAFYQFDSISNSIVKNEPYYLLQNPEGKLAFPHGIAFSFDGSFMVVTNFGSIKINDNGDISRSHVKKAQINVYRLHFDQTK